MVNSSDPYVDSKMGENDKSNMIVPEDMGEKGSVDEIEVMAETVVMRLNRILRVTLMSMICLLTYLLH